MVPKRNNILDLCELNFIKKQGGEKSIEQKTNAPSRLTRRRCVSKVAKFLTSLERLLA